MSNTTRGYVPMELNGPLSVVPLTPEDIKGKELGVCLLMGPTGSGKSAFIESLSPVQNLGISKDSLESVTQEVVCYEAVNLTRVGRKIVLLDTPGFLDTKLSESRITAKIINTLDSLCQSAIEVIVSLFYFQPITDIRMGGSKRDSVKLLRAFANSFRADEICVITTMWNHISSPKKIQDANRRFSDLKNEIFSSSHELRIDVVKFQFSRNSALSIIEVNIGGWFLSKYKSQKMDPQYQSLICDNLLVRITNAQQRLHILAEDKEAASTPGEDPLLLEVLLREEKVVLTTLQSFLDDLVAIGLTGLTALESLLDASYDTNPSACSSPWPQTALPSSPEPKDMLVSDHTLLPFASPILSTVQNRAQGPSSLHAIDSPPNAHSTASTPRQPSLSPLQPPSPSPSHNSLKARVKGAVAPLKGVFKNLKK